MVVSLRVAPAHPDLQKKNTHTHTHTRSGTPKKNILKRFGLEFGVRFADALGIFELPRNDGWFLGSQNWAQREKKKQRGR